MDKDLNLQEHRWANLNFRIIIDGELEKIYGEAIVATVETLLDICQQRYKKMTKNLLQVCRDAVLKHKENFIFPLPLISLNFSRVAGYLYSGLSSFARSHKPLEYKKRVNTQLDQNGVVYPSVSLIPHNQQVHYKHVHGMDNVKFPITSFTIIRRPALIGFFC
jgi:hypothetical protein